jgi:hypothetical protein
MANRTITFELRIDGVLTDADTDTVKLSNTGGTIGVKRNDTDAVVVADDTDFTGHPSTGVYTYTFAEPEDGLEYTAYIEWQYDGVTYRDTDILGAISTGDAAWVRARTVVAWESVVEPVTGQDIDDAIADSLAEFSEKAEPKYWAAWDIWTQIVAVGSIPSTTTTQYSSESLDGWSYKDGASSTDQMKHWQSMVDMFKTLADASETESEQTAGTSNSFQSVAVTYGRSCGISDENSA